MLFFGCFEARAGQADMFPRTMQQLPAIGFRQIQRFRNLGMCVIEDILKQIDRLARPVSGARAREAMP